MRLNKGVLIVIEGIDGSGKSTQARRLLRTLRSMGVPSVSFREPTRGKWGREIKKRARIPGGITPNEELELFLRDRRENVEKNLLPALKKKMVVVLDRYYFSTIAYQGARGIDPAWIKKKNEEFAVRPDLVFILDLGPREGLRRISGRRIKDVLFERERYLARVRRIFRSLRGRRFVHLDASSSREALAAIIASRVVRLLKRHAVTNPLISAMRRGIELGPPKNRENRRK